MIRPLAQTDFAAVPFPFRRQLNQHLFKLKGDPRPRESQPVDGAIYVLRVSGWRVVYEVDDDALVVTIFAFLPP